jgi:hypothetical protein
MDAAIMGGLAAVAAGGSAESKSGGSDSGADSDGVRAEWVFHCSDDYLLRARGNSYRLANLREFGRCRCVSRACDCIRTRVLCCLLCLVSKEKEIDGSTQQTRVTIALVHPYDGSEISSFMIQAGSLRVVLFC